MYVMYDTHVESTTNKHINILVCTHTPMQAQDCLFLLGLLSKAHIALDSGMLLELLSVATHTGHAALTQGVPRLPVEWVVSVIQTWSCARLGGGNGLSKLVMVVFDFTILIHVSQAVAKS